MSNAPPRPTYRVGDFRQDGGGQAHGWFVGHFAPESPRRTGTVEVMYWNFPVGPVPQHDTKWSEVFECTMILKGRVRALLHDQWVELAAGQYVAIQPHVLNNTVVEVLEEAEGITIKAPSYPDSKHKVEPR